MTSAGKFAAPAGSTDKIQVANLLKRSIPTEEKQLKVHASERLRPTSASKRDIARVQMHTGKTTNLMS